MVQVYKEGGENSTPGKLPREFTLESFDSTIYLARPCRNVSAVRRSRVLLSAAFMVASVSEDCIVILWIQLMSEFFVVERLSFAL